MKTIEEFKLMGSNPRRNGLGFVWLMESPKIRWNFYHPDLVPQQVSQYHNHQNSFVSDIMKGRFCNKRGKIVVPIKYETCYDYNSFYNGLAVLQIQNEAYNIDYKNIFYVDKEGNLFFE